MLAHLAYALRVAVVDHVTRHKHRPRVTRTVGFQTLQDAEELGRDVAERYLCLHLHDWLLLVGRDMSRHILLKATFELGQVLFAHRQTCGKHMPAKIGQQVAARVDGRINVKIRHAARRARDKPVLRACQYYRGTKVTLRQTRRYYTHHAFVPMLREHHRRMFARVLGVRLQLLQGLLRDGLIHVLTRFVVVVHRLTHRRRQVCVFGD